MVEESNRRRAHPPVTEDPSERRKHRRVDTPLKARFLSVDGSERPCLVVNISAGGALLRAKQPPKFGESIVVYIDDLGRFESTVVRSRDKSFAITFNKKRAKRAKTADNLTKVLNREGVADDRRGAPRIRHDSPATVILEDGIEQNCAILDVSLTGASIEINPRPPLGARLILGRMTAKVVRRHEKGVGVVFTGAAERMEDVIAETTSTEPDPAPGSRIAPVFGRKNV